MVVLAMPVPSFYTVTAGAQVGIGCPGPEVPGSQRSQEWNDKGGRRFVGGASRGYLTFGGDSPGSVCMPKCHRPLDPWMRGEKMFCRSSVLIIPPNPNNCMPNTMTGVRGCQRRTRAYKANDSPYPKSNASMM